jgi:hypothetical protein
VFFRRKSGGTAEATKNGKRIDPDPVMKRSVFPVLLIILLTLSPASARNLNAVTSKLSGSSDDFGFGLHGGYGESRWIGGADLFYRTGEFGLSARWTMGSFREQSNVAGIGSSYVSYYDERHRSQDFAGLAGYKFLQKGSVQLMFSAGLSRRYDQVFTRQRTSGNLIGKFTYDHTDDLTGGIFLLEITQVGYSRSISLSLDLFTVVYNKYSFTGATLKMRIGHFGSVE